MKKRRIINPKIMGKKRVYVATKFDAIKLFQIKTGKIYIEPNYSNVRIFKLKNPTKKRKYQVCTWTEKLNT